ncbi:hypothetical protein ACP70R_034609 [Stipagrostis hirtigluma subsp. patula]
MVGLWTRYAPHVLMTLVQLSYTLMYFMTEAAFKRGLNPYVYVTYRNLLAVLLWPLAYFHEKKLRPKMTVLLFLEIFVLSLLGVSLSLNMYFASLKYTSPTFVSTMLNTISSMTFVIAVMLRMEIVDIKSLRGLAKIAGTVVSFIGAITMTLYTGGKIRSLWKSPVHIHGDGSSVVHESWMKGSILAMASCMCWAVWYILQVRCLENTCAATAGSGTTMLLTHDSIRNVYKKLQQKSDWIEQIIFYLLTKSKGNRNLCKKKQKEEINSPRIAHVAEASSLKRYPAQLSLTAWMSLVGAIQSAVFTVFVQHKPEDWLIGFGLNFWCIVYSALLCNGFAIYAQLWCTEKKDPVFVSMFNPLCTIMVAILAYFIFGENLYVGSIIGAVVVIAGMYMLLWGKDKDHQHKKSNSELDCEKQARESDFETPSMTTK